MKKNLTLLSLVLSVSQFIYSQALTVQETPFTGIFSEKRIMADGILYDQYDAAGNLRPEEECNGNEIEYIHDKSGLIDTIIRYGDASICYIDEYSKEGYLLSRKNCSPDWYWVEYLKYDSIGRILESDYTCIGEFIRKTYDYKKNTIHFRREFKGNITEITTYIHYTDSGYIEDTNGVKKEYVFDSEKRLIRAGHITYSYFNEGYIKIDNHVKTIYSFQKDGYLSELIIQNYKNGQWVNSESKKANYIYNAPSSNELISKSLYKAYGQNGKIIIELEKPELVSVFSVNGNLITRRMPDYNHTEIAVPTGFYIVSVGKGPYKKVVVR